MITGMIAGAITAAIVTPIMIRLLRYLDDGTPKPGRVRKQHALHETCNLYVAPRNSKAMNDFADCLGVPHLQRIIVDIRWDGSPVKIYCQSLACDAILEKLREAIPSGDLVEMMKIPTSIPDDDKTPKPVE